MFRSGLTASKALAMLGLKRAIRVPTTDMACSGLIIFSFSFLAKSFGI